MLLAKRFTLSTALLHQASFCHELDPVGPRNNTELSFRKKAIHSSEQSVVHGRIAVRSQSHCLIFIEDLITEKKYLLCVEVAERDRCREIPKNLEVGIVTFRN